MGEVYLARHPRLPRRVALKLLRSDLVADQAFVQRFQRESETVAGLDHPAIVPIDDCGAEHGRFWFSMRYIDGITADEALRPAPYRLDPARAVRIIERVASALDFAHRRNLVHRDVKPANILLSSGTDDDPEQVFLSDFGVAKGFGELEARAPSLTATGGVVATVDYAAPEQIEAKPLDGRCDVYALGCVLFKLLTGRIPFPGESLVAKVHARMSGPTPKPSVLVPDLPVAFDQVIAQALERDRDRRFQTCRALALAARAALEPVRAAPKDSTTANLGNDTTTSLSSMGHPIPPRPTGPARSVPPGGDPRQQSQPAPSWPGSAPVSSWPGGGHQAPPSWPAAGPPSPPSWPGAGQQSGPLRSGPPPRYAPPNPPTPTPPPPSRTEPPMPTSINSLLGGTPTADRRRSVRNRSLLAIGLVVAVAAALVGTLWLTGGFTGSDDQGNRGTPVAGTSDPSAEPPSDPPTSSAPPSSTEPPGPSLPQSPEPLPTSTLTVSAPAEGAYAAFAIDVVSGEYRALTSTSPTPVAPVLSPDRRTVLWVAGDRIEVAGADGSGRQDLFTLPADCEAPARPSWNHANPGELVVACSAGADPRLLVMDLAGTVLRTLPTANLRIVDDVAVSPDGSKVLFRGTYSTEFDRDQVGVLWVVPLDGSAGPTELIPDATDGEWSPDGTRISYRKLTGTDAVIMVSNPDGDPQQFSPDGTPVRAAYFSRDGTRLAWTALAGDAQVLMVAEVADPSSARPVADGLSVLGPLTW